MNAALAVRPKLLPLTPGAAACAIAVSSNATATIGARYSRTFRIACFIFVVLIASLLIDTDFGHQPAEVLRVISQAGEVGGAAGMAAGGRRRGARRTRGPEGP